MVEASGSRHPGAIGSRCEAALLRGTYERCRGESTGLTLFVVAPDESLTNGWKLLEQGPESQSASGICSGGVSAVMGSSDLDALTLVSDATDGNQLSCSLPFGGCTTHRGSGVPRRLAGLKQHPSAGPATGFLGRDRCAPPGGVDGAKAVNDPLD